MRVSSYMYCELYHELMRDIHVCSVCNLYTYVTHSIRESSVWLLYLVRDIHSVVTLIHSSWHTYIKTMVPCCVFSATHLSLIKSSWHTYTYSTICIFLGGEKCVAENTQQDTHVHIYVCHELCIRVTHYMYIRECRTARKTIYMSSEPCICSSWPIYIVLRVTLPTGTYI